MSLANNKKHKREEKAARRAECDAKKVKKGPPEVEPPPCFLSTASDASTSASTSSVPASQASGQTASTPSQPSCSDKGNPNPQHRDPTPAPALNSDPASDDMIINKDPSPQKRPQQARPLQDEVPVRQRQLKKILVIMEHDRKTQTATKSIKEHHMAARLVTRVINPFMDSHNALSLGLALRSTDPSALEPESDSDEDSSDSEDNMDDEDGDNEEEKEKRAQKIQCKQEECRRCELIHQFNELLKLIPGLKTNIDILSNEQLVKYSQYLDYSIHFSRQDDTGHLVDRAIQYLPYSTQGPKVGEAPSMILKCVQGWHDYITARQLCPFDMLDDFETDWEQFCKDIMDGKRVITPSDFCAFLYCQCEAEKGGSADAGLL